MGVAVEKEIGRISVPGTGAINSTGEILREGEDWQRKVQRWNEEEGRRTWMRRRSSHAYIRKCSSYQHSEVVQLPINLWINRYIIQSIQKNNPEDNWKFLSFCVINKNTGRRNCSREASILDPLPDGRGKLRKYWNNTLNFWTRILNLAKDLQNIAIKLYFISGNQMCGN